MNLRHVGDNFELRVQSLQNLPGNRAGRDTTNGLTGRSTASALPVSDPEFCLVSEISVRWSIGLLHFGVGFRTGIFVSDENCNWCPESFPFEYAGQDLASVFLASLGSDFALPWPPAVELALNILIRHVDVRWTAVHHHADTASV